MLFGIETREKAVICSSRSMYSQRFWKEPVTYNLRLIVQDVQE